MAYIDDYIAQKVKAQKTAAQSALKQKLATLTQQRTQTLNEEAQNLPTYQDKINQEAAQGWQDQQGLAKQAASTGNLNSNELTSAMVNLQNGMRQRQGAVDNQRNQYRKAIQDRLNQLTNQGNTYKAQEADQEAQFGAEGAAEKAKWMADQQAAEQAAARQAARAAARVARASTGRRRSGGSGLLSGGGSSNPNTAAKQAIDKAANAGATFNEIMREIDAQSQDLINAGVNIKSLLNYADTRLRTRQAPAIFGGLYSVNNGMYSATQDYYNGATNGSRGMGGSVPF